MAIFYILKKNNVYTILNTLSKIARKPTINKIRRERADFKLSKSSFGCLCKAPECTGGGAVDAGAVVAVAVDLAEHQAQRHDLDTKYVCQNTDGMQVIVVKESYVSIVCVGNNWTKKPK